MKNIPQKSRKLGYALIFTSPETRVYIESLLENLLEEINITPSFSMIAELDKEQMESIEKDFFTKQ